MSANAWDEYVKEFGKNPENSSQLMNYSTKNNACKKLNFKEAKSLFDERSKKSTGKTSAMASQPESSNDPESKDGSGIGALFGDINKSGVGITQSLKHVNDSQKNKNRPKEDLVPLAPKNPPAHPPAHQSKKEEIPKKPGGISQQGPRIIAENLHEEAVHQLDKAEAKNDILIGSCSNCAFLVPNKVKAVTIDGCKKIQVEIHEVISMVELINCSNVTIYIKKTAPSITIDKCSAPKIFLFKEALDKKPNIITSLTSDMNIEIPGKSEEDDWIEVSIPQQFKISIDPQSKKVTTEAVEHV